MLLKISLGFAILVGLVTLYVTHFNVGGKITDLNYQLTTTAQELDTSRANETQLRADVKTLKTQLDTTVENYTEATNQLAQVTARAEEQFERANKATAALETTTQERNDAQRELAQWRAFDMTPEQIRNNLSTLRSLESQLTVAQTDIETYTRENDRLKRELRRYTGDREQEVILPPGTKGNVVAVDPKYDFVILDIGGNQGVLENAKMLVNRDGKLIGRVQITEVEPNRSIANVLPEWKQDEIIEGDQVVF